MEHSFATPEELDAIRSDVDAGIEEAAERALNAPVPEATVEHALLHVFSEDVDPTSAAFDTEPEFDGDKPIATPYDDCVLVMPSRRLRRGESAVRFGRFVAPP